MTSAGDLVAVGRTSDVYEYGRRAVVKVPRPSVPSHWAAMEAQFTAAVRELGAPAPAVLELVDVDGRPAIVFERVFGPSMWERMVEAPQDAPALARELALVHDSILSVGLPLGVVGFVERLRTKLSEVTVLTATECARAQQLVDKLPSGAALLHGDLHPGNVLMAADGPVVIDWFDAAIGHPMADVVRSSILVRPLGSADDRPHLPGAPPGLLRKVHDAYVVAMRGVIGASADIGRLLEALIAAGRLAEDAEADDSHLLDLWRGREGAGAGPLVGALSGGVDDLPD